MRVGAADVVGVWLNGESVLGLLGRSLELLLCLTVASGVTVHDNDICLDPTKILPPPAVEGRVTAVRVDGEQLVQLFGRVEPRARGAVVAGRQAPRRWDKGGGPGRSVGDADDGACRPGGG